MAAELAGPLCRGAVRDLGNDRSRGHLDALRTARGEFLVLARRRVARSRPRVGSRTAQPREDCTLVPGTRLRRCALLLWWREWPRMARARRRRRLGRVMGLLPRRRVPPVLSGGRAADRGQMLF